MSWGLLLSGDFLGQGFLNLVWDKAYELCRVKISSTPVIIIVVVR